MNPEAEMLRDILLFQDVEIVYDNGGTYMMMFNPEIIKNPGLYNTE